MKRAFFLTALVCVLVSCNQSAAKNEAANTASAMASIVLKDTSLAAHGIPIRIKMPEGAVIKKDTTLNAVIVVKDRFNVIVREETYQDDKSLQQWIAALKEERVAQSGEMAQYLKTEMLKNDSSGFIYKTTNNGGGKVVSFVYLLEKDKKKYIIESNDLVLMDFEKASKSGYAIDEAEITLMYNAVKQ